ncbi:MAG: lactate utilization protein [bacterium]|nr:lactate utilization protein [bacterium]
MTAMQRESFLANVRTSLEQGRGTAAPGKRDRYQPPAAPPGKEMIDRLVRELESVGGLVYRASSQAEARKHVLEILRECRARRVVVGSTPLVEELAPRSELEQAGPEVTVCDLRSDDLRSDDLRTGTSRESLREAGLAADVGISSVDYGVAETGTLALTAGPGQDRGVSLLAPIHVALLDSRDVVYELAALFRRVSAGGLPSALTLITGPSRTGDIELVLTVGVHGPRELHMILLER